MLSEKKQHRPESSYIDAAFRSSRTNEVFFFTGFHYFVVNYDPESCSQKDAIVTKPRLLLVDGFCDLFACTNFRVFGVDAAFGCQGTDEAFLFSRDRCARIRYDSNNEGQVLRLEDMIWLFPSPEKTVFSKGKLDAACESTVPNQAYLFKCSSYALVSYSDKPMLFTIIKEGRITDEFTCLRNTLFECDIDSAFASHESNQFYFFKDNTYVLIEFDSEAKESRIIAGPEEIVPTNWPCLETYLPYRKSNYPYHIQPETWEPQFNEDGSLFCKPIATNASPERHSSERRLLLGI